MGLLEKAQEIRARGDEGHDEPLAGFDTIASDAESLPDFDDLLTPDDTASVDSPEEILELPGSPDDAQPLDLNSLEIIDELGGDAEFPASDLSDSDDLTMEDESALIEDEDPLRVSESADVDTWLEGAESTDLDSFLADIPSEPAGASSPVSSGIDAFEVGGDHPVDIIDLDELPVSDSFAAEDGGSVAGRGASEACVDEAFLLELARDLIRSATMEELKETILFSLMGHVPVSSAGLIIPSDEPEKFILDKTRGIKVKSRKVTFRTTERIMNDVVAGGDIADLASFSEIPECSNEYNRFQSLGTRWLIPVTDGAGASMIISIGEKLSGDEMTGEERVFVERLADLSAGAIASCRARDFLAAENERLSAAQRRLVDIDTYEDRVRRSGSDTDVEEYIRTEMTENAVESFAFFTRDEYFDRFSVIFNENRDHLQMRSSGFTVSLDNAFTAYLSGVEKYAVIENPVNSDMLHRIFTGEMLTRMNCLIVLPYSLRGRLAGFALVFRMDRDQIENNVTQISRLAKVVFSYLESRKSVALYTSTYYDIAEPVVKRVADELKRCRDLGIPATAVSFSIKNFRRFAAVYGAEAGAALLNDLKGVLLSRLAETDFAVRISRNIIIAVFPGKGKRQVLPLANAVRNDITAQYRSGDVPVMMTFLAAEFPDEADTVYELMALLE